MRSVGLATKKEYILGLAIGESLLKIAALKQNERVETLNSLPWWAWYRRRNTLYAIKYLGQIISDLRREIDDLRDKDMRNV